MTQLVGYARVSTADQTTAMQLDALNGLGCARVFEETASGARTGGPVRGWSKTYAKGQPFVAHRWRYRLDDADRPQSSKVGDPYANLRLRSVNIPIYAIHRRSAAFTDPFAFDPDRFGTGHSHPGRDSYVPFGAGPRICLGASFAMAEAVTVLATIVRAVELGLPAPDKVWPIAKVSLSPKGGLSMVLSRR